MQNRSSVKNRRPTDINQLAKAIVDLAVGNPIVEGAPIELKKRPLSIKQQDRNNRNRVGKLKGTTKKITDSR